MLDARIAGIAGHEQYLEIRALPKGVIGELATIHAARHDDVSQQEINRALLAENIQGGGAIAGLQNAIAELFEYLLCVIPQIARRPRRRGWFRRRPSVRLPVVAPASVPRRRQD